MKGSGWIWMDLAGNLPKLIFRIQFSMGEFMCLKTFFKFWAFIFCMIFEFSDPVYNKGIQICDDTFQFCWKLPKIENELNSLLQTGSEKSILASPKTENKLKFE